MGTPDAANTVKYTGASPCVHGNQQRRIFEFHARNTDRIPYTVAGLAQR